MKRGVALVLGGAGFIGGATCRELVTAGYAVHGIGHGARDPDAFRAEGLADWTTCDLDAAALASAVAATRPTLVVNCAGSGLVSRATAAPLEDFDRTVGTAAGLLDAVRCHAPDAGVVLVSSAAVYGEQPIAGDLSEESPRAPTSLYGVTRGMVEELGRSYHRFFGVRARVVRLFSVYGEGLRKQLLWDAAAKIAKESADFFGTGDEMRDWLHVSDAAVLLRLAGERDGPFEVFNGGHVHAPTRTVVERLAVALDRDPARVRFTGEVHAGNPRRLTADCAKARGVLGWTPRVGLDEGIERYAAWWRTRCPA